MSAARALVRTMRRRHGTSERVRRAFVHGYHAAYHDSAAPDGCDERCASILASVSN